MSKFLKKISVKTTVALFALFAGPYALGWAIVVAGEFSTRANYASQSGPPASYGTDHLVGVGHTIEAVISRAWLALLPLTSEFGDLRLFHAAYTAFAVLGSSLLSRRVMLV